MAFFVRFGRTMVKISLYYPSIFISAVLSFFLSRCCLLPINFFNNQSSQRRGKPLSSKCYLPVSLSMSFLPNKGKKNGRTPDVNHNYQGEEEKGPRKKGTR